MLCEVVRFGALLSLSAMPSPHVNTQDHPFSLACSLRGLENRQGCPMYPRLKTDPAANKHAHVRRWLRNLTEKAKEAEEA